MPKPSKPIIDLSALAAYVESEEKAHDAILDAVYRGEISENDVPIRAIYVSAVCVSAIANLFRHGLLGKQENRDAIARCIADTEKAYSYFDWLWERKEA